MPKKNHISRRNLIKLGLFSLTASLVTARPKTLTAQPPPGHLLSWHGSLKPAPLTTNRETILTGKPLFKSFFQGGFECSTQRLRSGKRLDLIAATKHDRYATADYKRLQTQGIRTVREGIRWHLIEQTPGRYDFSSVLPMLQAARDMGMQPIWDLCHYGWPDDLDIFSSEFVRRFASMSRAFIKMLSSETDAIPFITPINEISFLAWAGGEVARFNPFAKEQGDALKKQLVRAAIEAIEAIWDVAPRTRLLHPDPTINVIAHPVRAREREAAEGYRLLQYQAWDMLAGRIHPELGGQPKYLDIIGVNYYDRNQWIYNGPFLHNANLLYRPFRQILREVYDRYSRPILIAETSAEDEARPTWLSYICGEAAAAIQEGVPVEGICLYPILNYPGWDDERHCRAGLWDYANEHGDRELYQPLADELHQQRSQIEQILIGLQ